MIIPPRSRSVKKWVLSPNQVRTFLGCGIGVLTLFTLALGLSYGYFKQRHDMKTANTRVGFLENNLKEMENRLSAADATLSRIQNFEQKLRVLTQLEDSNRHIGIGPLSKSDDPHDLENRITPTRIFGEDLEVPDEYRFEIKEASIQLDELTERASLEEQTLHELYTLLQDQSVLLSHTPSIWPVKGWVTSNFGYRASPFTGKIQLHEGMDIATRTGTPISAPANGTVVRVHTLEGYGKTLVIDHGYGIVTRYGHNSEILVKSGENVKRGQVIATVGSTGISTAPHLHYEVSVNGVPVDPRKYILD